MSDGRSPLFKGVKFDNVLSCVHCGLCLDACPTYRVLGTEQDSPRGRLYLMRGLWEGELQPTEDVIAPLSRCLDCRACEPACPSGVPYGELLEKTRGVIAESRPQGLRERMVRAFFLRTVLPSNGWLLFISRLTSLYLMLGIDWLLSRGPLRYLLPRRVAELQSMIPAFSGRSFKASHGSPAALATTASAKRATVGLFTGCIMDVAEERIHEATVRLLRAAGCDVVVPGQQTCCGALHVHAGERATARTLAEINERVFGQQKLDRVIVNAAGCGAQLKEYHHLFDHEPDADPERWRRFGERSVDVMEYLGAIPELIESLQWSQDGDEVLYDAPCHLQHAQGVDQRPRALLDGLPGVKLIALTEADMCCGSAGVYNLLQPELAGAVLDRKVASIRETLAKHPAATTLVTGNPGCLFQIRAGVRRAGLALRVIHPIEYLAERLQS